MRILIILGGTILLLLALVSIIGWLLPQTHTATRTFEFTMRPEPLWETLTDIESFPEWRSELTSVQILPPQNGLTAWRETTDQGQIEYVVTQKKPLRRLVHQIISEDLPYGGRWTFELVPRENGGTSLTITERGEIYNPFFRFMAKFVFGYSATIENFGADLKRHVERSMALP